MELKAEQQAMLVRLTDEGDVIGPTAGDVAILDELIAIGLAEEYRRPDAIGRGVFRPTPKGRNLAARFS